MNSKAMAEALRVEFPADVIKYRDNDGYAYIDQEVITSRLLDVTEGQFDVRVESGPTLLVYTDPNGKSVSIWVATVTVAIPGLGSRTQGGVARALTEDAPKAAITDGFKKACSLFGLGLQLYVKASGQSQPAQQRGRRQQATGNAPLRVEDGGQAQQQRAPRQVPNPNGPCTEAQRKAIESICKSRGLKTDDEARKIANVSVENLTGKQAGELIHALNQQARRGA